VHTFLIDLSGSGQSDGEFISLGYFERDDVHSACEFLRREKAVNRTILWGRSMGASLALWCAGDHVPTVVGCIADSPYGSLRMIMEDQASKSVILHAVVWLFGGSVNRNMRSLAGVGVDDISLWEAVVNAKVPALIVHGMEDDFIAVRQARELFGRYGCPEKFLWTVNGDHASEREIGDVLVMVEFVLRIFALGANYDVAQFPSALRFGPEARHYRNVGDMVKKL
jgi:pimeloyl-ACP methyl ester carboxylesterase